jgi:hypothetical protein
MGAVGDDGLLVKIAIVSFAISLVCTAGFAILLQPSSDYSYDEIQEGRDQLISFSGQSMINQTPWKLTHVYTPWHEGLETKVDTDGWLYGDEITAQELEPYGPMSYANIKLDPNQKSSTPLNYSDVTYVGQTGWKWYAPGSGTVAGKLLTPIYSIYTALGGKSDPYVYGDINTHSWNYTGYRYVFDPTLPISNEGEDGQTNSVDGSLSIVWYNSNNQEGLSGGLIIYGGDILIANYSATDIIADYNTTSGYATVYDFDFGGTVLTLSIRFDQNAIEEGMNLMQAWTLGNWSMAISSPSAGSFFDIDGSSSFTVTAGNMISTFMKIYTLQVPSFENEWANVILWILVGLPATLAMLCITLKLVNGFRVL